MKNKTPFPHSGFTLLEVLAAMVIFALGILALTRLQIASIQSNSFARQISEATNLAQSKMENLFSQDFNTLSCEDENSGIYSITCDPEIIAGPGDQTKEIHVKVTWKDSRNLSHQVFLRCIRAHIR
jgi:type IV pilus modification protein PilV